MNQQPMSKSKPSQQAVAKWLWITLIIVAVLGGFFLAWYLLLGPGKTTEVLTPVTTPTTTTKTTTTQTTTTQTTTGSSATTTPVPTTDLTYSSTAYGFTLTFPATWKGYKMKEASFDDSTATYYINVPTTDESMVAGSTADAGYYSPFAISVYTLAQWAAVEAEEGFMATLIAKNDTYAFAWSQANGIQPSDWTKSADIKTIIASFKLK